MRQFPEWKLKENFDEIHFPAGIYMSDYDFTTNSGIVNLHPTEVSHWVMFADVNKLLLLLFI